MSSSEHLGSRRHGSAAMLAIKSSAGVALDVNTRNSLHTCDKALKWLIHPDFETQARHHQKCETGVSVP